jgi:hypothetical protein
LYDTTESYRQVADSTFHFDPLDARMLSLGMAMVYFPED